MNRRTVFKRLAVASAAAWILPSCFSDPKKVTIALNRLQVSHDEEMLLADIAEVIIPETDTPGAVAVRAHHFALVMVDDCMGKDEQERYLKGLRSFQQVLGSLTGKKFSESSSGERLEMLTAFEAQREAVDEDAGFFYDRTRALIIQGYQSSQYFLTQVKPYQLVPGPNYNGCAPVARELNTVS